VRNGVRIGADHFVDEGGGTGGPGVPFGAGGVGVLGVDHVKLARAGQVRRGGVPRLLGGGFLGDRIVEDRDGRIGAADEREQFVEARGVLEGEVVVGAAVEPGEMREQQARIVAAAGGDRLAMVEHGFLDAVQGAIGEQRLGRVAGEDKRAVPGGGEARIAAAGAIGGLRRDADAGAGEPGIATGGEVIEKADAARGTEGIEPGASRHARGHRVRVGRG
jgi:hypothetical protein